MIPTPEQVAEHFAQIYDDMPQMTVPKAIAAAIAADRARPRGTVEELAAATLDIPLEHFRLHLTKDARDAKIQAAYRAAAHLGVTLAGEVLAENDSYTLKEPDVKPACVHQWGAEGPDCTGPGWGIRCKKCGLVEREKPSSALRQKLSGEIAVNGEPLSAQENTVSYAKNPELEGPSMTPTPPAIADEVLRDCWREWLKHPSLTDAAMRAALARYEQLRKPEPRRVSVEEAVRTAQSVHLAADNDTNAVQNAVVAAVITLCGCVPVWPKKKPEPVDVEKLREAACDDQYGPVILAAANEIERLRKEAGR